MDRVYATTADLDKWITTPPPNVDLILSRASQHIDSLIVTAIYDTTPDGMPTKPAVVTALRDATCAQVAWWDETGDVTGAAAQWQGLSAGSVSLTRGYKAGSSNTGQEARTAPEAVQVLATAGLLSHAPRSA